MKWWPIGSWGRRAKQSQIWEGWGAWEGRHGTCAGSAAGRSMRNKANCQGQAAGSRQRAGDNHMGDSVKQSQFAGGLADANCWSERGLCVQVWAVPARKTKPVLSRVAGNTLRRHYEQGTRGIACLRNGCARQSRFPVPGSGRHAACRGHLARDPKARRLRHLPCRFCKTKPIHCRANGGHRPPYKRGGVCETKLIWGWAGVRDKANLGLDSRVKQSQFACNCFVGREL